VHKTFTSPILVTDLKDEETLADSEAGNFF
jgi:hypothetical protein